ncbi:MAG TPA: filamentous hemagglutinin N-terminal domain-containing protein, partial [Crinalium sp.]
MMVYASPLRQLHHCGLGITVGAIALVPAIAQAQVIPDNSLGAESSTVRTSAINGQSAELIEGGARRGANLFHSFLDFDIPEGEQAYFANPNGVERILSRVTGNSRSDILGQLGVLGNADLFFLNPNGIVFGPNASLDLRGSFVTSTADSVLFDNGFAFSASNPQAPPLLTINVPVGLQMGSISASIEAPFSFLQVPTGQTLALVGGNVTLDGSFLRARQGRIELGAVGPSSRVGLNAETGYAANYQTVESFGDVLFSNGATASVSGNGAGNMQIQGRRIAFTDGSALIATTQGTGTGGTVALSATDAIALSGTTFNGDTAGIFARTISSGSAPDVTIKTNRLTLQDGARITTATLGAGEGGDLTINAGDRVEITGTTSDYVSPSALYTDAEAEGNAGTMTINTGHLILTQGSNIGVSSAGEGRGGRLVINATDSVELLGTSADLGLSSSLNSLILGTGDGQSITVNTRRLLVRDGGEIFGGTLGQGRGTDLIVNASDLVEVSGIGGVVQGEVLHSRLTTQSDKTATGNAGNLTITTRNLQVRNGGVIQASTFSSGNAGVLTINASEAVDVSNTTDNPQRVSQISSQTQGDGLGGQLTINTGALRVQGGSQVSVSTFARGNSGNLAIRASTIDITDSIGDETTSGLYAQVNPGASGSGGNLTLDADRVTVRNGARISVATNGAGDSGTLTIRAANSILVTGISSLTGTTSRITAQANSQATGNARALTINTRRLTIRDGGSISTSTRGAGNAGSLTIHAADAIALDGISRFNDPSSILAEASSGSTGNAGTVNITTGQLAMSDRALISVLGFGTGNPGDLAIAANTIRLHQGSALTAETRSSLKGANIQLQIRDSLNLDRNSRISASTQTGQAGNVVVNVANGGVRLQNRSRLSVEATQGGTAGSLSLRAAQFRLATGSSASVSSPQGQAGTLTVNANTVRLDRSSLTAERGDAFSSNSVSDRRAGALIRLNDLDQLTLRHGSILSALATGGANGGNVQINARNGFIVAIPAENSDVIASAERGNGGQIGITAQ